MWFPGSSSTSTEGPISDEGDAIRINENSENVSSSGQVSFSRKKSEELETFTLKESPFYDISKGKKLVMIFNHSHFDSKTCMEPRNGTEKDVQAIIDTFVKEFDVSCIRKKFTLTTK